MKFFAVALMLSVVGFAGSVLLTRSPLESVDAYDSIVTIWVHGWQSSRESLTANARK